ncbi:MAG: tRNA glutamyl-Q(34) synthetase GluQRS [Parvibaculales bacterium]
MNKVPAMIRIPENPRTRFAPSPNGRLHMGHAYSALMCLHLSKGGEFLLRIEDIDLGRRRQAYVEAIFEDLAWLGLTWPEPVMFQSERFDVYRAALDSLRKMGVIYPCWASRRDIRAHIESLGRLSDWPVDPDGALIYPGLYRDIDPGRRRDMMWEDTNYAWRLDMQAALALAEQKNGGPLTFAEASTGEKNLVDAGVFGDVIIARKDIPTTYHLSVVIDDADQGINLVTRGMDLQPATHIHRVLQVLLDMPEPVYFHHDLIRHDNGERLSKRAGDIGFASWREAGKSQQDLRHALPPPFGA